jgi:hypothetical protein
MYSVIFLSSIKYPVSSIEHPVSSIQYRVSSSQRPATKCLLGAYLPATFP